jgi:ketosteroid isomerase-like protein
MIEHPISDARLRQVVQTLYDATAIGDSDQVRSLLTDDFQLKGAPSLPYGGIYNGKDCLAEVFANVMTFWDAPTLQVDGITVGDGNAFGIVRLGVTSRRTGQRFDLEIAERFRFRGEKIDQIMPYYFDSHAVWADAQAE